MKIINSIKKHKLAFLIGVIIFIVFLIGLSIAFKAPVVTLQPNIGLKDPQFSPEPILQVLESEIFEVLSVYPGEGVIPILIPNEALGFRFSRPIDSDSVVFNIVPSISFTTSYDQESSVYYIHPSQFWDKDTTYTININAVSQQGEQLAQPYRTSFSPVNATSGDTGLGNEIPN